MRSEKLAVRAVLIIRLAIFLGIITIVHIHGASWPTETYFWIAFWVLVAIGYIIKAKRPPMPRYPTRNR